MVVGVVVRSARRRLFAHDLEVTHQGEGGVMGNAESRARPRVRARSGYGSELREDDRTFRVE